MKQIQWSQDQVKTSKSQQKVPLTQVWNKCYCTKKKITQVKNNSERSHKCIYKHRSKNIENFQNWDSVRLKPMLDRQYTSYINTYVCIHIIIVTPPALSEQSQFSAWCKCLLMAQGPKGGRTPNYTLAPKCSPWGRRLVQVPTYGITTQGLPNP